MENIIDQYTRTQFVFTTLVDVDDLVLTARWQIQDSNFTQTNKFNTELLR